MRLPISRPCMSVKAATTVSMVPRATSSSSSSRESIPRTVPGPPGRGARLVVGRGSTAICPFYTGAGGARRLSPVSPRAGGAPPPAPPPTAARLRRGARRAGYVTRLDHLGLRHLGRDDHVARLGRGGRPPRRAGPSPPA